MSTKQMARGALVAALYIIFTTLPPFSSISYMGNQLRVSEALTVLPFVEPAAIWGLFLGCFFANLMGPLGPWDIFAGSLLTLTAALLTALVRRTGRPWLAPLPPVLINAFGVSAYLHLLVDPPFLPFGGGIPPYFLFVISIGVGELVACYGLGLPLLYLLRRRMG
ncbi:hypothetical protein AMJ39_07550 [candidate division TA06 bacterium DG_24]|uniref:Transporter n=2 Tax=Bacteria division TA06 TaxID=1156500 RepID=A0A0S8JK62_UNCT6|nr:MAG: hypothetical protein AMJ39_07550 [candidate division TA06 bacterium DG_24]KPL10127.1 MAG: hypothetical protein AMJ71_04350 [candidate division TA06 bacterium SM1_40]